MAGSLNGRLGRAERAALVFALFWGAGLVAAALLVPVYSSTGASSSGTVTNGSATLVSVNGWTALMLASAPLAGTLVAGYALRRRAGQDGAGVLAWAVTGLLALFTVAAILSIGVFVLPVTVALAVASFTHGRQGARQGQ
jgi:hypothetical protein